PGRSRPARPSMRTICILHVVFLALGSVSAACTQEEQEHGSIAGTVRDELGGGLPGVTVTVLLPATGCTRTTTPGRSGDFKLSYLPAGTYVVTAHLEGFKDSKRKDIVVVAGETAHVTIELKSSPLIVDGDPIGDRPLLQMDSSCAVTLEASILDG